MVADMFGKLEHGVATRLVCESGHYIGIVPNTLPFPPRFAQLARGNNRHKTRPTQPKICPCAGARFFGGRTFPFFVKSG